MNHMIQNGYSKLAKRLFMLVIKRIFLLCALLFALTFILLLVSIGEMNFTKTYESLIECAGIRYIFLAAIAFWMMSEAVSIYTENFRNSGIYTMMMLPTPRRNVFLAYCTRGVVCMLMLWTVQTLALLAAYEPVTALSKNAAAPFAEANEMILPFNTVRTNGLFLAVIRSDLFRILLPQSVPEAISSLLALLAAGCLPALMLTGGLRHTTTSRSVFAGCAAVCVLWALGCRFGSVMAGAVPSLWMGRRVSRFAGGLPTSAARVLPSAVSRLSRQANFLPNSIRVSTANAMKRCFVFLSCRDNR
ncbi:MAG: hypothetical protein GX352_02705 [Clostridiales bacterium]|nr:hypothetical protein [Clostridiales bacterium]